MELPNSELSTPCFCPGPRKSFLLRLLKSAQDLTAFGNKRLFPKNEDTNVGHLLTTNHTIFGVSNKPQQLKELPGAFRAFRNSSMFKDPSPVAS